MELLIRHADTQGVKVRASPEHKSMISEGLTCVGHTFVAPPLVPFTNSIIPHPPPSTFQPAHNQIDAVTTSHSSDRTFVTTSCAS